MLGTEVRVWRHLRRGGQRIDGLGVGPGLLDPLGSACSGFRPCNVLLQCRAVGLDVDRLAPAADPVGEHLDR